MTSLAIIIPVLDEASSIVAHLARLSPLRSSGTQIIVVDGGSKDATASLAADGCDLFLTAPRGRARQMNAGADRADADVLLFLHADTSLPPGADRIVIATIENGALWGRFDVRIDGRSSWLPVIATLMNFRSRLTGIATGDQAIFVRRDVFTAIGGFADQPLMEDIELSRRLRALSRPASLRTQVSTSGRRWESHGVWRTILLMWRLRLRYFLGVDPKTLAREYGYAAEPPPTDRS